ncbi:MAG: signal peptidase II [Chloroflexi bacterium]|nr:signal peptidase II [Chloroflexota bacterium]MCL5110898.1 signal peptidase II [Chloroflexota bacterium]
MRDWQPGRHLSVLLLLAGSVLLLDQVSKTWIVKVFTSSGRTSLPLAGDWLRFSLATNTGAAFGLLPQQTWLFVVAAVVVVPVIIYLGGTTAADPWPVRLSFGLMLGGSLGNLVDRIRLGHVVDFVDVGVGSLRWPSFNVADSAFVVGTILVVAYVLFWPQTARPREVGDGAPPA